MSDSAKAVFLSYASQDAEAARKISESLCSAGVEVWFDQSELRGGDAWDAKIRTQIRECALFVPVISANTQARLEGYFRLEWKLAEDRSHLIAKSKAFIVPVVVDDTSEREAHVPEVFLGVQWMRLGKGEAASGRGMAAFCEQVTRLLNRAAEKADRVVPNAVNREGIRVGGNAHHLRKAKGFPAALAIGGLIILAAGAWAWFSRSSISDAGSPATDPAAELTAASAKSITVLPFENRSSEPDSAYFADGIQEEILSNLSLIADLTVRGSRPSVERYRSTTKSLPEVARELGVAWVLLGSVERSAGNVTVRCQLIRAGTDNQAWGKTFTRELKDQFAIQAEIAQSIAASLQATISPQEKALLQRRPTENLEAWNLYLKERDLEIRQPNFPTTRRSRQALLEQAVVLDPKFLKAWYRLSSLLLANGTSRDTKLTSAKAALDTMTALDADAPETALARINFFTVAIQDNEQALAMYVEAARVRPQDGEILEAMATLQARMGRRMDGIASMRKALALDPGNVVRRRNLVGLLTRGRRFDEALVEQRRVAALLPTERMEGFRLGRLAYDATGSTREMEKFFASVPRAEIDSPEVMNLRITWNQLSGNWAEAVRLDRIQPDNGPDAAMHAAITLAARNDLAAARARLEEVLARLRPAAEQDTLSIWTRANVAVMEAILGNHDAALRHAITIESQAQETDSANSLVHLARMATIYAWAGEKDRALSSLTRLLQMPGIHITRLDGGDDRWTRINMHELKTAAEFFPLHGDPRFEALLNDPKNNAPLF